MSSDNIFQILFSSCGCIVVYVILPRLGCPSFGLRFCFAKTWLSKFWSMLFLLFRLPKSQWGDMQPHASQTVSGAQKKIVNKPATGTFLCEFFCIYCLWRQHPVALGPIKKNQQGRATNSTWTLWTLKLAFSSKGIESWTTFVVLSKPWGFATLCCQTVHGQRGALKAALLRLENACAVWR